ncbi:ABC transporter ATP-binding protein [Bacillus sp. DJP31]|uniref:ABC transporter ATP-binding protein n=1 Tax=Bacillus sp. DJP31 TaxID=3409789 RepID=UPI003BB6B5F8
MFEQLSKPFRYKRIPIHLEKNDTPTKKKPKAKDWVGTIKRIWGYLSVSKSLLSLVFLMIIVSSVLGLVGPFLVGFAIDRYIVEKDTDQLFFLLIWLMAVYLMYSVSLWLQNIWMIGIAQKTVSTMRNQLFQHLHELPIRFFDKRQHGELMSRITNDIENVSSTLNSSVIQIFSSILTLIGTISVMFWLSPSLTMITLTIIPAMFYGLKWITKRTGKLFKESQRNLGELNGFIEETISGQRIVKTFSQETRVMNEFIEKSERLKGTAFWAQTFTGFIPKLMNFLNNLIFAIIACVGGIFALNQWITIGAIVIFTEYSRQFTRPLNDLANQFNTLLSAVAGAERVFEILDEELEEVDESNASELTEVRGEVEFIEASFSYEQGEDTVRDLTFHVSPGQTVALVGPTGAGKTTVINLLSRFYELEKGSIFIDGKDLTKITRGSIRQHMGFVLQDSFLFEGTILENIRYGKLDATDEEVVQAAKLANAHSFIMKLPNAYNMKLKHEGSGISQGQRQLLSIARAVLAKPSILLLDEATSSIDTITEIKIQEALQELMKGRTSFVIAHRLNTIQSADLILVLKDGQIIEKGTHQELMAEKGFYYDLYH